MALSAADIRTYAKDDPSLNYLLETRLQSSDALIELAMRLAVDDFNSLAPSFQYQLENFPSDTVLLYGTLHHLSNGEAERQLRNQVTYSAQGVNAGIDDKFQQYNALAQYYRGLFDSRSKELKIYLNAMAAWGGSMSPYSLLNQYQYRD